MAFAAQRLVALGALGAGAAAMLACPAISMSAAAPGLLPAVPLLQELHDVAVAADGTVRTLEVRPDRKSGGRATIRRLDPAGAPLSPLVFRDPADDVGYITGALTPAGGAVIFITKGEFESEVVSAVNVSPSGQASAPQPVAGPGTAMSPEFPRVGPTGAVAAMLPAAATVVFRPAGAVAFVAPLVLADRDVDVSTSYEVAMAPGGGAAVLAYPEGAWLQPYVRRIDPAGHIGPKIDLGFGTSRSGTGGLAFAANGDLGVILHHGPRKRVGAQVLFTTLPAGSDRPAPVQVLPAAAGGSLDRGFTVDLDAGETNFAVLTGRGPDGLQLWTGAGKLQRAATFSKVGPYSGDVEIGVGGVITTMWDAPVGADPEGDSRIVAAQVLPDGTVTARRQLVPRSRGMNQSVYAAVPLADGRLAVVYDEDPGPDAQLLGRIVSP